MDIRPASEHAASSGPTRRPRRPRPLVPAALGLVLLAASCAPSADDSVTESEPEGTFERIEHESFLYTDDLASAADLVPPTEDDPYWRIVGSLFDPTNGRTQASVWESTDSRDWNRHDLEPAERATSEQIRAVTRLGDGGLLAVGSTGLGEESEAAIWRSGGGAEADWEQTTPSSMGGRHEQWGFDVAAGPGGVVVAGGERAWGDVRPRLWHSADGEEWSSVDGGTGGPFAQNGQESISEVAAVGDGFVAVGWERIDGEQNGLAWYSPDGVNWEAVEAPELGGEGRQALLSVTSVDGSVVAGGYTAEDGRGRPVVWRSEDGQSWSGPSDPLAMADSNRTSAEDAAVRSLQVAGPAVEAPAEEEAEEGEEDSGDESDADAEGEGEGEGGGGGDLIATGGTQARPNFWRSSDAGASWERVTAPGATNYPDGVDLVTAARAGSDTVAIGTEPLVIRLADDRWLGAGGEAFPDGGAKPVGTSVVLDEENDTLLIGGYRLESHIGGIPQQYYEAHVWRREGDGDFEVIGPPEEPEEGEDSEEGEEGEEGGGDGEPSEAERDAAVQQFDAGAIEAMSAYGDGYVAVGVENFSVASLRFTSTDPSPHALLWTSPDGVTWSRYAWTFETPSTETGELAEVFTGSLDDHDPAVIAAAVTGVTADQPLASAPPAGGSGTRSFRGVTPMGDHGFMAVGSRFENGSTDPIVALATGDEGIEGEDTGLSGDGTQRYHDVCRAPGTIIAVGATSDGGSLDTAVSYRDGGWNQAEASDDSFSSVGNQQALACATSDDGFVAVGSDDSGGDRNARVWTSDDGVTWEEVTSGLFGGSGDQEATAVAPFPGGGWLVAGSDSAGDGAGIALWHIRTDGSVSRRDMGEPALTSSLPMSVRDMVVGENRTILVGTDVDGLGIWESATEDLDR